MDRFASVMQTRAHSSLEVIPRSFSTSSKWTRIAIPHLSDKHVVVVLEPLVLRNKPGKQQHGEHKGDGEHGDLHGAVDHHQRFDEQELQEIERDIDEHRRCKSHPAQARQPCGSCHALGRIAVGSPCVQQPERGEDHKHIQDVGKRIHEELQRQEEVACTQQLLIARVPRAEGCHGIQQAAEAGAECQPDKQQIHEAEQHGHILLKSFCAAGKKQPQHPQHEIAAEHRVYRAAQYRTAHGQAGGSAEERADDGRVYHQVQNREKDGAEHRQQPVFPMKPTPFHENQHGGGGSEADGGIDRNRGDVAKPAGERERAQQHADLFKWKGHGGGKHAGEGRLQDAEQHTERGLDHEKDP